MRGEARGVGADGGFGFGQGFADGEEAGDDPFDVAIDDGGGLIKRGGGDDGGRVGAQAGEGEEFGFCGWEFAVVFIHDGLRAFVEEVGAAVVSEACPEVEDLFNGGGGEGLDGGEFCEEAGVVGDDGGHCGLLEHDFRQPDGVGIACVAPGHGAGGALIPGEELRLKLGGLRGLHVRV